MARMYGLEGSILESRRKYMWYEARWGVDSPGL